MVLTEAQIQTIAQFRTWVDERLAADAAFGPPVHSDRPDLSTLTTRYRLGRKLHLEVTIRPLLPQVRVGIVTDDRWRSEELEDGVESSGDSMEEFLEVAFAEAGLDWEEPPVEHYRHEGTWYSYITPVDLKSLDELSAPELREKVGRMIAGYVASYGQL